MSDFEALTGVFLSSRQTSYQTLCTSRGEMKRTQSRCQYYLKDDSFPGGNGEMMAAVRDDGTAALTIVGQQWRSDGIVGRRWI